jgi:hypothetical protein
VKKKEEVLKQGARTAVAEIGTQDTSAKMDNG